VSKFQNPLLLIMDPAFFPGDRNGHYGRYVETLLLGKPEQWEYIICGQNRIIEKNDTYPQSFNFQNVFSSDIWGAKASNGSSLDPITCNQEFYEESLKIVKSVSTDFKAYVLLPNATPYNLLGYIRLATENQNLNFVALLRYQRSIFDFQIGREIAAIVETHSIPRNLNFVTDSDGLVAEFTTMFPEQKLINIDIPLIAKKIKSQIPENVFRVSTFGNARGEKGIDCILEASEKMESSFLKNQIVFDLQLNSPSLDVEKIVLKFKSKEHLNACYTDNSLEDSDYDERLARSQVILLPYSEEIYRNRTSGVLREAEVYAKPLIVSKNTWLENQINSYAGGVVVDHSAEGIIHGVREIQANYDRYEIEASIASEFVSQYCSPQSVFKRLEKSWNNQNLKKLIIFYPWGINESRASGSGHRLTQIRDLLERAGIEVLVISPKWNQKMSSVDLADGVYELNFDFAESQNIHLRLFKGRFSPESKAFIRTLVHESTVFFFLGAHLVNDLIDHLKVDDSNVIIESSDILAATHNISDELFSLEIQSLTKGMAFNVSKSEVEVLNRYLPVRYSNISIKPKYNLSERQNEFVFSLFLAKYQKKRMVFFPGSRHKPNVKAAEFLLKVSSEEVSKETLFVFSGTALAPFESKNVLSLGIVPTLLLEILMRKADFVLNPVFEGTGVPVKVMETLSLGGRVYATGIGARNLESNDRLIIEDWRENDFRSYAIALNDLLTGTDSSNSNLAHSEVPILANSDALLGEFINLFRIDGLSEQKSPTMLGVLASFASIEVDLKAVRNILEVFTLAHKQLSWEEKYGFCIFLYSKGLASVNSFPTLLKCETAQNLINSIDKINWKTLVTPWNPKILQSELENEAYRELLQSIGEQKLELLRLELYAKEVSVSSASKFEPRIETAKKEYLKVQDLARLVRSSWPNNRVVHATYNLILRHKSSRQVYDYVAELRIIPSSIFSYFHRIMR
jgi:hypothetical protein